MSLQFSVNERSSKKVTFTLQDDAGAPVPLAALATAELTVYVPQYYKPGGATASYGIVNARRDQNILNANNVTIAATSGLVTWNMQAADAKILGGSFTGTQRHRALFRFVTTTGVEANFEMAIDVLDLQGRQ